MKRRSLKPESESTQVEESLCRALLALDTVAEMRSFLRDLCTPAELEALIDRWRVVPYLLRGMAYREIHDRTAVSVTTIGRVARFLSQGNGGYQAAIAHHAVPAQLKPAQLKPAQLRPVQPKPIQRKPGRPAASARTISPAKRARVTR